MRQQSRLRPGIQTLAVCLSGLSALAAVPLAAQSHHFVYLSSATDQTISGFELSPAAETLTPITGSPFNEPVEPGAMTLHPSGRFLYVMNAGAKTVSAFAVNPVTGVLNEGPASPFAVGGGNAPKFFVVEPSGKFLYVVSTSDDVQGKVTWVSYYAVDQATGALSATPEATLSPFLFTPAGFVSKPEDKFLYLVGTANASNSIVSIYTIELDPATGAAVSNGDLRSGQGQFVHSVAISRNGPFLFVGRGQSAGSIDTYTISADGIPQYSNNTFPIPDPLALPYALAVDASGSYLYASVAAVGIRGFSVDSITGGLASLGPPFIGPPVSPSAVLVADPLEQFLYFEQRAFAISGQGALDELSVSPLAVAGSVTGIAAANPLDAVQPISVPQLTLVPSPLQFSEQFVGASTQLQISLSYTGTATPILSSISLTGINKDDFSQSNCPAPAVLQPGNGCTILITFQPTAEGLRQATLTVLDNAIGPHTVALTGTGQLPFTIQLDSARESVIAGQMARYDLRLVPAPGFAGQILLACAGAPAGAVCDVPPSVQLDESTPKLFAASVLTTARSVLVPIARRPSPGVGNESSRRLLIWGALLALLLWTLPRPRPALAAVLWAQLRIRCTILLLLVCVSLSLASCAGIAGPATSRSPGSTSPTGTPAGVYTLTLTAASGGTAQTLSLTLAVQ